MRTKTNYSGGIQGGITNGEPIIMRAAFKPTATIIQDQDSVNEENEEVTFKAKGRHDPCVVPRAVPICEAMAALVLIDHALRQRAQGGLGPQVKGRVSPVFSSKTRQKAVRTWSTSIRSHGGRCEEQDDSRRACVRPQPCAPSSRPQCRPVR